MIEYTVYDKASGKVLRTGTAMTEASANLQGSKPGTSVKLVGSDPKTEIIGSGGVVTNRQPMRNANGVTYASKTTLTADGADSITIHFVPAGAKVEVFLPPNMGLMQPEDAIVNDGVLVITTTVRGIYQIRLSYLNFIDFEVSFNAN